MRWIIITIYLLVEAFDFLLEYLDYSRMNAPLPESVKDIYDEETYKKYQSYSMDNTKFSIISGLLEMVVPLACLIFSLHYRATEFLETYISNPIFAGLLVLGLSLFVQKLISALLGLYDTFVIEERYGFNNTTLATYIMDFLKEIALFAIIGGGLFALLYKVSEQITSEAYITIAFFAIMIVFSILSVFLSPLFIRLFNELTPLEEGELKDKVVALVDKTNYKIKGIYTVDASKRSTKTNAFAAGFGKTRTIGLYDTLMDKFTDDEIIAILAHEIGHEKKRHILKQLPYTWLSIGVIFAIAQLINNPQFSMAFGFSDTNLAFSVYAFFILISPINIILNIPLNALSRKFEYEADLYEKEYAGKDAAISAMKKLYSDDLGNLTPHPFVVMINHSHPTAAQRIEAFEK